MNSRALLVGLLLFGLANCRQPQYEYIEEADAPSATTHSYPAEFVISSEGLEKLYNSAQNQRLRLANQVKSYQFESPDNKYDFDTITIGPVDTVADNSQWEISSTGSNRLRATSTMDQTAFSLSVRIHRTTSTEICRFDVSIQSAEARIENILVRQRSGAIQFGSRSAPNIEIQTGPVEGLGNCLAFSDSNRSRLHNKIEQYIENTWRSSVQKALRIKPVKEVGFLVDAIRAKNSSPFENRIGSTTIYTRPSDTDSTRLKPGKNSIAHQLSLTTEKADCAPPAPPPVPDLRDNRDETTSRLQGDIGFIISKQFIYQSLNHLVASGFGCLGSFPSVFARKLDPSRIGWKKLEFSRSIDRESNIRTQLRLTEHISWSHHPTYFGRGFIEDIELEFYAENGLGLAHRYLSTTFDLTFNLGLAETNPNSLTFRLRDLNPENIAITTQWKRSSELSVQKRRNWLTKTLYIMLGEGLKARLPFAENAHTELKQTHQTKNKLILELRPL